MTEQKDMLARLLATENLTVVHGAVKTASFNVKERILTIPMWKDMQNYTYDHLIGHEVGHALYTPTEEWLEEAKKGGAGYKSFLNVVEDARIEKLVQRRYPGLRRQFIKSYKAMMADGFFGATIEEINDLKLIDRLNTYFKCGPSAGVRIDANELVWVNEIENCETWEQVVDVASRLYAKAKEEQEQEEQDKIEFELDGEGDSDGTEFEFDFEGENEEGEEGESKAVGQCESDVISSTDQALENAIEQEFSEDPNVKVRNLKLNTTPVDSQIVSYKRILDDTKELRSVIFTYTDYDLDAEAEELYSKFVANNKRTISYLVKEFEMKKSAKQYARASVAKTGVIDPVLMNSYKYNDDIFRKMTVVPDGKSHGMIMYLDWSGSMARDMYATVEQTLNLVHFCRQVNIPFRVYAFTNRFLSSQEELVNPKLRPAGCDEDTLCYRERFALLEFFSNKMRKHEQLRMSKVLLAMAKHISHVSHGYSLGATPLNDAIMAAHWVYDSFKKQTKVDIVNTIFLTDGDSHSCEYIMTHEYDSGEKVRFTRSVTEGLWSNTTTYIHNPITKKKYRINRAHQETNTFLRMYREYTNSNVIGFRIMPISKWNAIRDLQGMGLTHWNAQDEYNKLKKEKYISLSNKGYSKFFIMAGGKNLETANGHFEVSENASKNVITTAFKKANSNKLQSRSLLNEFIKEVA